MTSLAEAKSEVDLQTVMQTVIHYISYNNKEDDFEANKNFFESSVNDINFDDDPYFNFDITDPYLDFLPRWRIGSSSNNKKKVHK